MSNSTSSAAATDAIAHSDDDDKLSSESEEVSDIFIASIDDSNKNSNDNDDSNEDDNKNNDDDDDDDIGNDDDDDDNNEENDNKDDIARLYCFIKQAILSLLDKKSKEMTGTQESKTNYENMNAYQKVIHLYSVLHREYRWTRQTIDEEEIEFTKGAYDLIYKND